ncbi:MAG: phage head morphogenesis protein [Chloroflexota bacterium]|nr:phage head morphogenesis protein [Chloroflexota bacterium]
MRAGWDSGAPGANTTWRREGDRGKITGWADKLEPAPPVKSSQGFWTWIEVDATSSQVVIWTSWATGDDERVCPECGPLDGLSWEEGAGPEPPLHINCRCERVYAFTDWRTRYATVWELRWIPW